MKFYLSMAVAGLVSATPDSLGLEGHPVSVAEFHFNEDPHSVPDPLAGKAYLTSTQAADIRSWAAPGSWIPGQTEQDPNPHSIDPRYFSAFNKNPLISQPVPNNDWMTHYWGDNAKSNFSLASLKYIQTDADINMEQEVTNKKQAGVRMLNSHF